MSVHHGKNGAAYITIPGSPAALLMHVSEWSLDQAVDTVETTSMGAANKTYVAGLKDCKGALSGFWDDTDDLLFDAIDSIDGCGLALYPDLAAAPTKFWAGPAWLSGSIKSGVSAAVTFDGNFVANGAWTRQ